MTASHDTTPATESSERLPSQGVRTVISLLVFIHLFALAVALLSTPRDGMASPFLYKLRQVPLLSTYLRQFWMDMAYDYFHTYGNAQFVAHFGSDHQVLVELTLPDGQKKEVLLPDPERTSGPRFRRYQNLANGAAGAVGRPEAESLLPAALCQQLLQDYGAESCTLRIRRHLPQSIQQRASDDESVRDPFDQRYYQTIYTGYGSLRRGRFGFQKLEEASDSAPVATSAPAANS